MPVRCMVNFFGCGRIWRLVVLLGHFLFGLQEDGTIPYTMICISLMEYVIQRYVLVSTPASASA
jgi:hypothetical protein